MKWKKFVSSYLNFSRKERIGLLAFSVLIIVIFLLPKLISSKGNSRISSADTAWITKIHQLETRESENGSIPASKTNDDRSFQYDRNVNSVSSIGKLFYFDPNTVDKAGWIKLGISEKTIATIHNYLNKGGHFYKPEDLKKIYGLRLQDYTRLEPYIKIEASREMEKLKDFERKENETRSFAGKLIDINIADTSAFITLPGIGSKLAARIVNFRDKLGGFYSIEQVKETYGLPDSTFQKIKARLMMGNTPVKKININTATIDELKAHPYIKYSLAKPLVAYRDEHGPFIKVEDIKKVMAVTDELFNKIAPYISLQ